MYLHSPKNTSECFLPILKTESINITDRKMQREPSFGIPSS